ncbi:MAG: PKD domain-containing protein, partial [Candidatus Geothermarchaeales archaeon]
MQGRGAVRLFEREGSGLAATAVVFLLLSLTLQTVKASVDLEPIIEGPVEVEVGEPASFDATSSGGAIINYTWDFRDGSFAFGPDVEHSFQREGTYLVGLTITDIEGRQALGTHMMRVVNSPPVAAAEARLDFGEIRPLDLVDLPGLQHVEVSEDQTFLLSAAASSDAPPDVPGLKYAWSLGDGRTASGRHVVVSYPDAGLYRVILQVVDPHGAFDTDEVLVRVVNVPPTAVLG